MHVTVAICTWNRAKLLDQTLTQMRNLRIPEWVTWELLVVNNNSPDDTDEVIARHSTSLPIRRLFEPKQGHCNARNCAIEAATGEIMLWTDDDVLVGPEWLAAIVSAAARTDQTVAFFGGQVDPWFETAPDPVLLDALPGVKAGFCGLQVKQEGVIDRDAPLLPVGANFAVKMSAVGDVRFDPELGRQGDQMRGGDEYRFLDELRHRGYIGQWVVGASLRHFVCAERMRMSSILSWYYELGKTWVAVGGIPEGPRIFGVPRWMFKKLAIAAVAVPLNYLTGRRKQFYSQFAEAAAVAGRVAECRKLQKQSYQNVPPNPHASKVRA